MWLRLVLILHTHLDIQGFSEHRALISVNVLDIITGKSQIPQIQNGLLSTQDCFHSILPRLPVWLFSKNARIITSFHFTIWKLRVILGTPISVTCVCDVHQLCLTGVSFQNNSWIQPFLFVLNYHCLIQVPTFAWSNYMHSLLFSATGMILLQSKSDHITLLILLNS